MASFCRPIPAFHLSQVTSLVFSKFRSFVPSAYYRQGMSSPSPKHSPLASAFPINWERAHVFWNSEEGLSLARFIVGARLCVTGRFISQLSLFWSTVLPEVSESVTVRIAWLLCEKSVWFIVIITIIIIWLKNINKSFSKISPLKLFTYCLVFLTFMDIGPAVF